MAAAPTFIGAMDEKIIDEGVDAYCAAIPRDHCPYAPGTQDHRDWLYGWDQAALLDIEERGARH